MQNDWSDCCFQCLQVTVLATKHSLGQGSCPFLLFNSLKPSCRKTNMDEDWLGRDTISACKERRNFWGDLGLWSWQITRRMDQSPFSLNNFVGGCGKCSSDTKPLSLLLGKSVNIWWNTMFSRTPSGQRWPHASSPHLRVGQWSPSIVFPQLHSQPPHP